MTKSHCAFSVLLVAIAMAIESAQAEAAQSKRFFERFTLIPETNGQMHSYPCMDRLEDGLLLLVWAPKNEGVMQIMSAFSDDHGKTWTEPVFRIGMPGGLDGDPGVVVSGRRVFLTSTRHPPGDKKINTSTTWCVRSNDSGETWSPAYQIPMNHRYTCGKINKGVRLKSGTLLMGYSWDKNCEAGEVPSSEGAMHLLSGVMISNDDGDTWMNSGNTDSNVEPIFPWATSGTAEPAIIELEDGSIYMLVRTGSKHLYESRSFDEGKTWSAARPSPLRSNNTPASLCRFKAADGRHGIMCVWNNHLRRIDLSVAASFDGGRSWTTPRKIDGRTDGRQVSYPACLQTDEDTLIAVWQEDRPGGRVIASTRFNVAWLLHDPIEELQRELSSVELPGESSLGSALGYTSGDPCLASLRWTIQGDGGIVNDNRLELEPSGGYFLVNQPKDWNGNRSSLVECRMRVVSLGEEPLTQSAAELRIGGSHPRTVCQLFFREDAVSFESDYAHRHELDATELHTYRILTNVDAGNSCLYIDNARTPALVTHLGALGNDKSNRILFGDVSVGDANVLGQSEWEFVRWRSVKNTHSEK